jgi:membrane protein DedA with SNARE-associated domain
MRRFCPALVPFVAGASRMPFRQFLWYNALGAAIWSAGSVLLGYFLGASWRVADRWIGRGSLLIGGAVLLALVVTATRRHARTTEVK